MVDTFIMNYFDIYNSQSNVNLNSIPIDGNNSGLNIGTECLDEVGEDVT